MPLSSPVPYSPLDLLSSSVLPSKSVSASCVPFVPSDISFVRVCLHQSKRVELQPPQLSPPAAPSSVSMSLNDPGDFTLHYEPSQFASVLPVQPANPSQPESESEFDLAFNPSAPHAAPPPAIAPFAFGSVRPPPAVAGFPSVCFDRVPPLEPDSPALPSASQVATQPVVSSGLPPESPVSTSLSANFASYSSPVKQFPVEFSHSAAAAASLFPGSGIAERQRQDRQSAAEQSRSVDQRPSSLPSSVCTPSFADAVSDYPTQAITQPNTMIMTQESDCQQPRGAEMIQPAIQPQNGPDRPAASRPAHSVIELDQSPEAASLPIPEFVPDSAVGLPLSQASRSGPAPPSSLSFTASASGQSFEFDWIGEPARNSSGCAQYRGVLPYWLSDGRRAIELGDSVILRCADSEIGRPWVARVEELMSSAPGEGRFLARFYYRSVELPQAARPFFGPNELFLTPTRTENVIETIVEPAAIQHIPEQAEALSSKYFSKLAAPVRPSCIPALGPLSSSDLIHSLVDSFDAAVRPHLYFCRYHYYPDTEELAPLDQPNQRFSVHQTDLINAFVRFPLAAAREQKQSESANQRPILSQPRPSDANIPSHDPAPAQAQSHSLSQIPESEEMRGEESQVAVFNPPNGNKSSIKPNSEPLRENEANSQADQQERKVQTEPILMPLTHSLSPPAAAPVIKADDSSNETDSNLRVESSGRVVSDLEDDQNGDQANSNPAKQRKRALFASSPRGRKQSRRQSRELQRLAIASAPAAAEDGEVMVQIWSRGKLKSISALKHEASRDQHEETPKRRQSGLRQSRSSDRPESARSDAGDEEKSGVWSKNRFVGWMKNGKFIPAKHQNGNENDQETKKSNEKKDKETASKLKRKSAQQQNLPTTADREGQKDGETSKKVKLNENVTLPTAIQRIDARDQPRTPVDRVHPRLQAAIAHSPAAAKIAADDWHAPRFLTAAASVPHLPLYSPDCAPIPSPSRSLSLPLTPATPGSSTSLARKQLFQTSCFLITGLGKHSDDSLSQTNEHLNSLIRRYGGRRIEDFRELDQSRQSNAGQQLVVLSNRAMRTAKYMFSLARGVPPIHVDWLDQCVHSGTIVPALPFSLPCGLDQYQQPIEFPNKRSLKSREGLWPIQMEERVLHNVVVMVEGSELFREEWSVVVQEAGAKLYFSPSTPDCLPLECHYILVEPEFCLDSLLLARIEKYRAHPVLVTWLIESLIHQRRVNHQLHKYRHSTDLLDSDHEAAAER